MNWKKLFNFRYILISLYVLITALLLYCGSRAIDHIPELWAAVTGFFRWFRVVLHPLITGFALCYLLTPVVNFFEQRLAGFRTLLPRTAPPREAGKSAPLPGLRRAPHFYAGLTCSHPVALAPHFGAQQQRATCKFKRPLAHDQGA